MKPYSMISHSQPELLEKELDSASRERKYLKCKEAFINKVFHSNRLLDPLDKDAIKHKLEGWAHVYQRLTTKHAQFDFGPQIFEAKSKKKHKKQQHH